jgi:LysM repeat protein
MRQLLLVSIISGILSLHNLNAFSWSVRDSTGVINMNGKRYITHQVEAGETLYSLARRYNTAVQDIVDANPNSGQGLKVGAVLRIPVGPGAGTAGSTNIHTVAAGETLYSISRRYGVELESIRALNNLSDNSLRVGQKLRIPGKEGGQAPVSPEGTWHIVKESETLYSISKLYNTSPAQLRRWNNLEGNQLKVGQRLRVAEQHMAANTDDSPSSMLPASAVDPKEQKDESTPAASATPTPAGPPPQTSRPPERDYSRAEKITESGLAEVITDSDDTRKYLAMHRTAPVGTIMQIKNQMNNQVVFVRVVGTIQSTGDNGKVLVMISKKAYERLGAVDKRFPVEISYIP